MQAGACGIQIQRHPVVHNGQLELKFCPGLRQPGDPVLFTQTPGGGLFHNGLTVRHTHQRAVQAVALHRELAVSGDELLQRRLVDPLKQLFKGFGLEFCQHQQHPLAGTQAHIGLCHSIHAAGKQHAAILRPDIFYLQPFQLVSGNTLQAEEAGHRKLKFCHKKLLTE